MSYLIRSKKVFSIVVMSFVFISLCLPLSYGEGNLSFKPSSMQLSDAEKAQAMENEIINEELIKLNQEVNKYIEYNNIQPESVNENEAINDIRNKYLINVKNKMHKWLLDNGWEVVEDNEKNSDQLTIASSSSDLSLFEDSIYYNSTSKQYRYTSYFNFSNIDGWDQYGDIEDIMAIRSLKEIGIVKGYARTFRVTVADCVGYAYIGDEPAYSEVQSGYDENGSNSYDSKVNKRFENEYGYVWNVIDGGGISGNVPNGCRDQSGGTWTAVMRYHDTDSGIATLYFTKTSGTTNNKIFLDYDHNWKTYSWNASATIGGVNLAGSALTVNYTAKNHGYKRTSPGKTF